MINFNKSIIERLIPHDKQSCDCVQVLYGNNLTTTNYKSPNCGGDKSLSKCINKHNRDNTINKTDMISLEDILEIKIFVPQGDTKRMIIDLMRRSNEYRRKHRLSYVDNQGDFSDNDYINLIIDLLVKKIKTTLAYNIRKRNRHEALGIAYIALDSLYLKHEETGKRFLVNPLHHIINRLGSCIFDCGFAKKKIIITIPYITDLNLMDNHD